MGIISSVAQVNEAVDFVTKKMVDAFNKSCPLSRPPKCDTAFWWTKELRLLRTQTRILFNKAKSTKREEDWVQYQVSFKDYKRQTRTAKRISWSNSCGNIETTVGAARLRKVLAKTPLVPSFLLKGNNSWTNSNLETLELLLETHCGNLMQSLITSY